jgi:hypothetical protein
MILCKTIILVLATFLLLTSDVFGQKIYGKITDPSGNPIPFATLQSKTTKRGTTTNEDGVFGILFKAEDVIFNVSCIGYETKIMVMQKSDSLIITQLKPQAYTLSEVVIMPDNMLLKILKEAYQSIPQNYSQNQFSMEGYYLEKDLTETNELISLAELILKAHQNGYQHTNEQGQIEILKTRSFVNPRKGKLDNVSYYAGPFMPIESDPVKSRAEYLNYKNFNSKYRYKLENVTVFEADTLYNIKFNAKDNSASGTLSIDKKSKAYVSISVIKAAKRETILPTIIKRIKSERTIHYKKLSNKWYLESMTINGLSYNKSTKINLVTERSFFRTNIDTLSKTINAAARLNYEDVYVDAKINYDENFFENNTILEKDALLTKTLLEFKNQESEKNKVGRRAFVKFISKINFEYSLGYFNGFSYSMPNGIAFSNTKIEPKEFKRNQGITFNSSIGYNINQKNEIYFSETAGLFMPKSSFGQRSAGYRYNLMIPFRKHTHYFSPNIELGHLNQSTYLQKMEANTIPSNWNFLSSDGNVYLNLVSRRVNFGSGIGYGIKKFNKLIFVQITNYFILNDKTKITANQELSRKKNKTLNFDILNKAELVSTTNNLIFKGGIRRYF